jgi:hypothetical protein
MFDALSILAPVETGFESAVATYFGLPCPLV